MSMNTLLIGGLTTTRHHQRWRVDPFTAAIHDASRLTDRRPPLGTR